MKKENQRPKKKGLVRRFIAYYRPHVKLFTIDMFCAFIISVLNLIYLAKFIGFKPSIGTYLRPIIATLVMGAVAFFVNLAIHALLGTLLSLVVSIGAGAVSYATVLLSIGGITREDALLLPKGEKIANLLRLK